jgi:hypothetical protein
MPFVNALSVAINQQLFTDHLDIEISNDYILHLFQLAISSADSSMMEEQFLRLLSSLVQSKAGNKSKVCNLVIIDHFQTLINSLLPLDFSNISKMKGLSLLGILSSSCSATSSILVKSTLLSDLQNKFMKIIQSSKSHLPSQVMN